MGILAIIGQTVYSGSSTIQFTADFPLTTTLEVIGYTPTFTRNDTVATITDYQGVVHVCNANEARFYGAIRTDHADGQDYGSGALGVEYSSTGVDDYLLRGFLAEETSTNQCTKSRDYSHADWTKLNITVGGDSITAIDGTTRTTNTLTASAGNGTCLQTYTASSDHSVYSVYLKRKTGLGDIDITCDGGSTWTTAHVETDRWLRVRIMAEGANPQFGVRIVTSGDAVYIDGSQLEYQRFVPSSVIFTDTIAVTRLSDQLTYNISTYPDNNFTAYCTFHPEWNRDELRGDAALIRHPRFWGSGVTGAATWLRSSQSSANLVGKKSIPAGNYEDVTAAHHYVASTRIKTAIRQSSVDGFELIADGLADGQTDAGLTGPASWGSVLQVGMANGIAEGTETNRWANCPVRDIRIVSETPTVAALQIATDQEDVILLDDNTELLLDDNQYLLKDEAA